MGLDLAADLMSAIGRRAVNATARGQPNASRLCEMPASQRHRPANGLAEIDVNRYESGKLDAIIAHGRAIRDRIDQGGNE